MGRLPLSLGVLMLCASPLQAADEGGPVARVSIAASNMDGQVDAAVSGSFGYRLSRVVTLEVEASLVPKVTAGFSADPLVIQE